MSAQPSAESEHVLELLADHATGELGEQRRAELERLLSEHPGIDPYAYERAAAAIHLACLTAPLQPLPSDLARKLHRDAAERFHDGPHPRGTAHPLRALQSPRRARSLVASPWTGWVAAAAALLVAVFLATRDDVARDPERSAADLRAALARSSAASIETAWASTGDALGEGVTGDVLWNPSEQRGFMRFRGLAANDPAANQYQLWIFDAQRPDETPVDGGVFDIPVDGGEVVVPIAAKLAVADAKLFAITLERPGGVVVSKRERLLLAAAVN